ncbi:hypothetical protein RRG08_055450 [Elysia crispata]|uniref:Uncharacterized protein n=1 Tax=Elysia crispata TaxID=231223 RepID=A0AAE1DUU2_9GAST|nr:hypothetical protein RRG08_055450 [Elysia crispata]
MKENPRNHRCFQKKQTPNHNPNTAAAFRIPERCATVKIRRRITLGTFSDSNRSCPSGEADSFRSCPPRPLLRLAFSDPHCPNTLGSNISNYGQRLSDYRFSMTSGAGQGASSCRNIGVWRDKTRPKHAPESVTLRAQRSPWTYQVPRAESVTCSLLPGLNETIPEKRPNQLPELIRTPRCLEPLAQPRAYTYRSPHPYILVHRSIVSERGFSGKVSVTLGLGH